MRCALKQKSVVSGPAEGDAGGGALQPKLNANGVAAFLMACTPMSASDSGLAVILSTAASASRDSSMAVPTARTSPTKRTWRRRASASSRRRENGAASASTVSAATEVAGGAGALKPEPVVRGLAQTAAVNIPAN